MARLGPLHPRRGLKVARPDLYIRDADQKWRDSDLYIRDADQKWRDPDLYIRDAD